MRKIIVTGGSGLLGGKIIEQLLGKFDITATYNTNPLNIKNISALRLDLKNPTEACKIIKSVNPEFIIHTAALTNVDICETHQKEAFAINVKSTESIAKTAAKIGAKVVYISTDYVFDGKKGAYSEDDVASPMNYYGKTKLKGELRIKEFCGEYAIGRLSSLYGWNLTPKKLNFATWIIAKLRATEEIRLFTDQYTTPTFADNAAEVCAEIVERDIQGVYHIASKECMNRFEFGMKVSNVFGLDENLIKGITTEKLNLLARRPKRCCLNTHKAERKLKTKLLNVTEALREMKKQENAVL